MALVGSVAVGFKGDTRGLDAAAQKAIEQLNHVTRQVHGMKSALQEGFGVKMASGSGLAGLGGVMSLLKGGAAALAIKQMADFTKDAAIQTNKLAASGRTLDTIFGSASKTVKGTVEQLASGLGLARVETTQLAVQLGANLTNAGIDAGKAADTTAVLLKRAADMAAATGYSASDAVTAIASALRGEYDPIEKFGVGIKAAAVEQQLLAQGVQKINGEFDQQSKTLATLSLFLNQTSKYQGAAAEQTNTASGALAKLNAEWEKFILQFGTSFEPVVVFVGQAITGWIMLFNKLAGWFRRLQYWIAKISGENQSFEKWSGEDQGRVNAAKVEGVITAEKMKQLAAAQQMKKAQEDLNAKIQKHQTDKMLKAVDERHEILSKLKSESVAKQYGASDEAMQLLSLRKQLGDKEVMRMAQQMDSVKGMEDKRIEPEAFRARTAQMAEAGTQSFYKLQLSAQGYDHTPEKDTAKNTSKMADTLEKMLKALEGGNATPELASF